MGTRAMIGIKNENGTVTAIYNQCDGGLQNLGHLLRKYFNTEEKVRELIDFGYISSIQDLKIYTELTSQFSYEDDEWAELKTVKECKVHKMPTYNSPEELDKIEDALEVMIVYAYLYVTEERKWYYTKGNKLKPLKS